MNIGIKPRNGMRVKRFGIKTLRSVFFSFVQKHRAQNLLIKGLENKEKTVCSERKRVKGEVVHPYVSDMVQSGIVT